MFFFGYPPKNWCLRAQPVKHQPKAVAARRYWFALALVVATARGHANGIYGNGTGARAMAMGGADVAWAADPLGAMAANPAGLGFLCQPELDLGIFGVITQGNFNKSTTGNTSSGKLDDSLNGLGVPRLACR